MIAAHRHRQRHAVLFVIGVAILVYVIGLALYLRIAHAVVEVAAATATAPVAAPAAPAPTGIAVTDIVAWVGGILAALSVALHWIAPRTKTPVDDWLRDAIIEALTFFRGRSVMPAPPIPLAPPPAPAAPAAHAVSGSLPLLAILVLGLAGSQASCSHSARTETLQAAQLSVGAARDSLATYDQLEQDKIVLAATSFDGGRAMLVAWRHKRAVMVTAIATAFRAISIAGSLNDQPSLDTALAAAGQVVDAIKALVTKESP